MLLLEIKCVGSCVSKYSTKSPPNVLIIHHFLFNKNIPHSCEQIGTLHAVTHQWQVRYCSTG